MDILQEFAHYHGINAYFLQGQKIRPLLIMMSELKTNKSRHLKEICGLKWSLSGNYLASGGNDN